MAIELMDEAVGSKGDTQYLIKIGDQYGHQSEWMVESMSVFVMTLAMLEVVLEKAGSGVGGEIQAEFYERERVEVADEWTLPKPWVEVTQ